MSGDSDNKDFIRVNKKALRGVAPAVAIIGLLLAKGQVGPMILFMVGIACGIIIGKDTK